VSRFAVSAPLFQTTRRREPIARVGGAGASSTEGDHMARIHAIGTFIACGIMLAGCGAGSAVSVGKNLMRKDSHLKLWLDGHEAKQNKLKKAAKGYARYEVGEPVSVSPKFKYEIEDVDKFGFIKSTHVQVHQKFEADFSDIADFVIFAKNSKDRSADFRPGVEYDLANLGPNFTILNGRTDQEVSKVEFKPGVKYMLVFTVVADKSESTQIFFETK
jgi:hypothetical protein